MEDIRKRQPYRMNRRSIGYKEIKLFPMKSNEPTIKIMLKNGGQIIGDFKDLKYIIRIPLE